MISFESVGDYPNGYSLTNDEFYAIHEVMEKDPSCNYTVRERGVMTRDYHLEVWASYPDENIPAGPGYIIRDGMVDGPAASLRVYKDPDDGAWIADIVIPDREWSGSYWTQPEAVKRGLEELDAMRRRAIDADQVRP